MADLWPVGVALVVIGSLGNNFGTNLVSYDHKLQEQYDAKHKNSSTKQLLDESNDNSKLEQNQPTYIPNSSNVETKQNQNDATDIEQGVTKVVIPTLNTQSIQSNQPQSENNNVNLDGGTAQPPANEVKKRSSALRHTGVFIFVSGNLLTFAAFGFAAQSLLAALESIQFVSNIAFAKYIHEEIITTRMLIATASIIVGNVLVVIFSNHAAGLFTSQEIINLYLTNTAYQVYLAVAALIWLIFHVTFTRYYNARIHLNVLLPHHAFMEPFAFSVSSAIIGTQAVLQAKCMSMLIQLSARGTNEFAQPTIWVILVAWLFFVVFWLKRLDLGLALFPPLFIIPVLQVFFVFFAILCGGIFFEEFVSFGAGQWTGFVVGVLMILGGVYGLAPIDTNSVVVLPNTMAAEVAKEVKEGLQEIPEALQSARKNVETSMKNLTPRISAMMTPRGTNGRNSARASVDSTMASPRNTPIRNQFGGDRNSPDHSSIVNATTGPLPAPIRLAPLRSMANIAENEGETDDGVMSPSNGLSTPGKKGTFKVSKVNPDASAEANSNTTTASSSSTLNSSENVLSKDTLINLSTVKEEKSLLDQRVKAPVKTKPQQQPSQPSDGTGSPMRVASMEMSDYVSMNSGERT